MKAESTARSAAENGGGIAGSLVGLGVLTMALFPFLIPGLAVLAVFTIPLVAIPIAAVLGGALVAAPWLAMRALGRRVRRRQRVRASRAALGPG